MKFFIALSVFALGAAFSPMNAAHAQDNYPQRPVRIVVPFSAGGSSDTLARIFAEHLGTAMNGNFVVENKPGAGTLIGTMEVKNANPDGYRLLLADIPFTLNPSVTAEAAYDPVKDFTPIVMIGASAQFMFTRPERFQSAEDLVNEARKEAEAVSFANAGVGTTTHLMTLVLEDELGIKFLKVPYNGSAPALTDTAAGHTDAAFSSFASASSLVGSGQLKPIATSTAERLPNFPDLPTFAELGAEELIIEHWWGLFGPAGMPEDVAEKIRTEMQSILKRDDVKERLATLKVTPRGIGGDEFSEIVRSYVTRWQNVVAQHNLRQK